MLFRTPFHSGIRDGTITLTFRRWKSPRVTAGHRYRFGARGQLEVNSIDEVRLSAISAHDARRAGFETVEALKKMVDASAAPSTPVFRVEFHYVGEGGDAAARRRGDITDAAIDAVCAQLARSCPARTASSESKRKPATSYERIYAAVSRIPRGRVATYGQIAALAGLGGHARQVGYALSALPEGSRVPWHRVINARGEVSPRSFGGDDESEQRTRLERERVVFDGAGRVSLKRFQWSRRGSA